MKTFIKNHLPDHYTEGLVLPFEVMKASFSKHEIITDYGSIEGRIFFLDEGIIQVSTLRKEEERILEFVLPGRFFCAYTSFLLQRPADVQITALSPCSVSIIQRPDLLRSNKTSLLSSHLNLCIAEQLFLSRAKREKDLLTKSAEDLYKELMETRPELINKIPVNKIARYLGIHAESLSRIRKSSIS